VLEGDRLVNTPYDIKFRVDKENEDLCSRELTSKDLKRLRTAVKKDYYFQVISPPPSSPAWLGTKVINRKYGRGFSDVLAGLVQVFLRVPFISVGET
jgi:hypothetical protein